MGEGLWIALEIGLKGMAGIFTVLGLLAVCVWALSKSDQTHR